MIYSVDFPILVEAGSKAEAVTKAYELMRTLDAPIDNDAVVDENNAIATEE